LRLIIGPQAIVFKVVIELLVEGEIMSTFYEWLGGPPRDLQFLIDNGFENIIQCNVLPTDVLKLKDNYINWVDPIEKPRFLV